MRLPDDDAPSKDASPRQRAETGLNQLVQRAAVVLRKRHPQATLQRLEICRELLAGNLSRFKGTEFSRRYLAASRTERHYLVGALYVLLLDSKRRQRLAAYFTPPLISNYVISQLEALGFNPSLHSVLDPACGGAAFLVPLAERMLEGIEASEQAVHSALSRLAGVEIEPGLATLSQLLIADAASSVVDTNEVSVVRRGNALRLVSLAGGQFDVVVSNPPYGRVFTAKPAVFSTWRDVITDGHVNTYALFVRLSLHLAKPGGIVALLIPTSFIGGPYFANLRATIRQLAQVVRLDLIEKRSNEFIDAIQDTCILFLRRNGADAVVTESSHPLCSTVHADGTVVDNGVIALPTAVEGEWILPDPNERHDLQLHRLFNGEVRYTLEDYGYNVRSGYLVWNRSQQNIENRDRPKSGEIPLVWANNISANAAIRPKSRPLPGRLPGGAITFARVPSSSSAIIREPAIVLQRTTNRRQRRRLIAGYVPAELVTKYEGYVTENHTIVVRPKTGAEPLLAQRDMTALLNSAPVDALYRRVSGTVSISTTLLRQLPLPRPALLVEQLGLGLTMDKAVAAAYAGTLSELHDS